MLVLKKSGLSPAFRPGKDFLDKVARWSAVHPRWALVVAVLLSLGPFLTKPFNMDDPLFIWAAHHIQTQPGNPYGFDVNWYGSITPMCEVTKNPPLACYFIAGFAKILGWSELALHVAFLLPALAVIWGVYRLAHAFCDWPLLAALLTLLTPVFLVSSTTVMCDVLMLSLWVWAVVLWVEGTRKDALSWLLSAGLLMGLAALTKYYAVALVPLLAAYSIIYRKRLGIWSLGLLLPVAMLCAYHLVTQRLYGRTLLSDALNYTAFPKEVSGFLRAKAGNCLTALTFTGGCLAMATFITPMLWQAKQRRWIIGSASLLAVMVIGGGAVLKDYGPITGSSRLFIELQFIFWATGGVSVLALAIADLLYRRDADSWLLLLWVTGTFLFAAMFNWTVNGRTILPMVPAVAILLVRRLEQNGFANNVWSRRLSATIVAGAVMAFLVARADFLLASSVRQSAQEVYSKHATGSERFWFQGHWGFQYYMEIFGASALDVEHTLLQRRDVIATPQNNANLSPLGSDFVVLREMIVVAGPGWLTTMAGEVGAGFYASLRGPLPFAFGFVPPERVAVCVVDPLTPPIRPRSSPR